jgi:hypothetical protein
MIFMKVERNFQHWLATNKTLGNGISSPGDHLPLRACIAFKTIGAQKKIPKKNFFFFFFLIYTIVKYNPHNDIFVQVWCKDCLVKPLGNDIPCIALVMVRITFPGGGSNVPQRLGRNRLFHPARWDKLETPPDKVILTITRAMQGMSHTWQPRPIRKLYSCKS